MINIKKFLSEKSEQRYAEFSRQLIKTMYPILGVRLPILQKFAREIEPEYIDFSDNLTHEEILLYGYSAGQIKDEIEQIEYLENILPYIDNWCTCDCIVGALRKLDGEKSYQKFLGLLNDEREYYVRVGIVGLMKYFLKSKEQKIRHIAQNTDNVANFKNENLNDKIDEILEKLSKIKAEQKYVKMALGWYYAELCTMNMKVGKSAIKSIEDEFVRNQSIKKACESFRISPVDKLELQKLKIAKKKSTK